jgi:hypothetical protein
LTNINGGLDDMQTAGAESSEPDGWGWRSGRLVSYHGCMKVERIALVMLCFGTALTGATQADPAPQPVPSTAPAKAPPAAGTSPSTAPQIDASQSAIEPTDTNPSGIVQGTPNQSVIVQGAPNQSGIIVQGGTIQSAPVQSGVGPALGMMHQMSAQMDQMHNLALASHLAMRATILGVLSPAQRALVASTIGQLAITPNPDRALAARAIDATLSAAQRQTIAASVIDAFDRDQAAFTRLALQVNMQNTLPQQAGARPLVSSQVGSMQVQMHNALLEALRNQTTGSVIIAVLSSPSLPGPTSVFSGPGWVGPMPAAPLPNRDCDRTLRCRFERQIRALGLCLQSPLRIDT